MLLTESNVLSFVQEKNGRRVLILNDGDRLSPAARDVLRRENIGVQPKKPEHMTNLDQNMLVAKNHPRIAFRGKVDSLQAEILLMQKQMPIKALQDMLDLLRAMIRAEVLNEPMPTIKIGGMDEKELHERSHMPQKYYGIGHFLPEAQDDWQILRLNRLRTMVRETELCCYAAFEGKNGKLTRTDILTALNRMSSACWVLCLERKGGCDGQTH